MAPAIVPETIVRTTQPDLMKRSEWSNHAWSKRKWGVKGRVIGYHYAHRLYYEVLHESGSKAYYFSSEIEVIE